MVTFILLVAGGLNWLLYGVLMWDVGHLLGDAGSRILYVLVGLAAIYEIATHRSSCRDCEVKHEPAPSNDSMMS
jgi:uncharacterized membrane protein YuzA (DUF378 family)